MQKFKSRLQDLYLFILFIAPIALLTAAQTQETSGPERWEKDIQAFEELDRQVSPSQDAVLFLGSSSIRLWDLEKHFPEMAAINRGFGGSQIEDSIFYLDRIVFPYKPRAIVFYAGDNDIASGKSPERVLKDYQTFTEKVHAELPQTAIHFISIKPSIRRWEKIEQMREANRLIQEYSQGHEKLHYIDIDQPMIGEDDTPRPDLFIDDMLHLNEQGYELWTGIVKDHLAE